jgi:hypothetical protein
MHFHCTQSRDIEVFCLDTVVDFRFVVYYCYFLAFIFPIRSIHESQILDRLQVC